MAHLAEVPELPPELKTKYEIAKIKYATKVCGYLGLPPEKCFDEFERLYRRMRMVVGMM